MQWTKGFIGYLHVKIFSSKARVYNVDALKDSGFQGRQEYLTPMDLTSRVKNNNGGTRTLIDVGEIINNNSHAKRCETTEIEK